ncbi:MAG: hypothetical protein ABIN48_06115, partial [Ginsengibacter sp.]
MKVVEFALKNRFSSTDQEIVRKLYGDAEKKEMEWFGILKSEIHFDQKPYLNKKKDIIEKIREKKNKSSKRKLKEK